MKYKLSILICTMISRERYLERLIKILKAQRRREVEVIINKDNGEKSIGQKRNELIGKATGEYICFIDDDDIVVDTYIDSILYCINKSSPDVVGFELDYFVDDKLTGKAFHSIKYNSWFEQPDDVNKGQMLYYRNPNHLNPIKSVLIPDKIFPEINNGEDRVYSMSLLPLLKSEEYIDKSMYRYLFRTNKLS